MSKENKKKELLKVIDDIAEIRKKLNELQEKREEATKQINSECEKLYIDLEKLQEKKRIIETDLVESMVYE